MGQGDKGVQGEQGEKGVQGNKGEEGDKGDKGEQGATGEQGAKGDKGEQGNKGPDGGVPKFIIGKLDPYHSNKVSTLPVLTQCQYDEVSKKIDMVVIIRDPSSIIKTDLST